MNLSSRELYRLERWSADVLDLDTLADDEDGRPALLRWLAEHQFAPSSSQSAAIEIQLLTDFGQDDVHTFDSPPPAWHDALEAAAAESVNKFIGQFETASTGERWEGFSTLDEQTGEYPAVAARLAEVHPAIPLRPPEPRTGETLEAVIQRRLFDCVLATPVERSRLVIEAYLGSAILRRSLAITTHRLGPDWASLCPALLNALHTAWGDISAEQATVVGAIDKMVTRRQADSKATADGNSLQWRDFTRSIWDLPNALHRLVQRYAYICLCLAAWGILTTAAVASFYFFPDESLMMTLVAIAALFIYVRIKDLWLSSCHRDDSFPESDGWQRETPKRVLREQELVPLRQGENLYKELSGPDRQELDDLLYCYETALATGNYLQIRDTRADLEVFLARFAASDPFGGAK